MARMKAALPSTVLARSPCQPGEAPYVPALRTVIDAAPGLPS